MKTSIWYHAVDKQPSKSGYYIAFKGMSMGDDSSNTGYYYYNKSAGEWRDSSLSSAYYANVYYWTDADPEAWVDSDPPLTKRKASLDEKPAVKTAWENVQRAIEQYEIIKGLS